MPTYSAQFSSGSYLAADYDPTFDFGPWDWTLSGWYWLDSDAEYQFVFGKEGGGGLDAAVYHDIYTGNSLGAEVYVGATPTAVHAAGAVTAGAWHHYVFWHDATAGTINLRRDGGATASAAVVGTINATATRPTIAKRDFDNMPLTGREAALGKWGRVLTAGQRNALYNAGNGRYFADLSASLKDGLHYWYDLQEASGDRAASVGGLAMAANGTVGQADGIPGNGGVVDVPDDEAPTVTVALAAYSASSVTLSATVAGVPSPTVQWYASPTPHYTPGAGTLVAGATSTTLTDPTGTLGVPRYYKCVATNTAGSAVSLWRAAAKLGAVPTAVYPAALAVATLNVLFVGDSITAAYGVPDAIKARLEQQYPGLTVNIVNAAVSGSRSNDWVSGSSYLNTAKAAAVAMFGAPSPTNRVIVLIRLGVNDPRVSPPGNNAATYTTNMTSTLGDLVADGYEPVLDDFPLVRAEPPGNLYDTDAGAANALAIRNAIDGLCDGTTVKRGDPYAFALTGNEQSYFISDDAGGGTVTWVHPSTAGVTAYAELSAAKLASLLPGAALSLSGPTGPLADGDTDAVPGTVAHNSLRGPYTVTNNGTVDAPNVTVAVPANTTLVGAQPGTIPPGESRTFRVRFWTPAVTVNGDLVVSGDGVADITVGVTATVGERAAVVVTGPGGELVDGGTDAASRVTSGDTRQYVIRNDSDENQAIGAVSSPNHTSVVLSPQGTVLAPGAMAAFIVRFETPGATVNGTLSVGIDGDDPREFTLTATIDPRSGGGGGVASSSSQGSESKAYQAIGRDLPNRKPELPASPGTRAIRRF